MKNVLICSILLWISLSTSTWATIDWPQQVKTEKGNIIVYQPQPEKLEGNQLSGRSAMSLEIDGQSEPVFGVFWFIAKIDTDKEAGTATVYSIEISRVRWPNSKDSEEQVFTHMIEKALPLSGFDISLDRLAASLSSANLEVESLEKLKNDPPLILFKEKLAVLLSFDGEPRFSPIENSDYQRALNTPFLVIGNKNSTQFYLSNGNAWFTAKDPLGPWGFSKSVPNDLISALPKPADGSTLSSQSSKSSVSEIVVATEPTELIVSDGKPKWVTLPDGNVLYVKNTESPWLKDLESGNNYILLSGRWFRAKTTAGPWTFVRPDKLPKHFANIPPASDIGGIRTSVAGTAEAEQAILDAEIPQTAAIKRSEASLTVEYDGKPEFKSIPQTKVSYALNTGAQVLEIENKYYAVDNGVWFVAQSAKGPWSVADTIPAEAIAEIPPSAPVYNTKYVHVYHSTPEVVYMGYTPGYMWSFPYYGVPVYGSGWYYPPYAGPIYYPRPVTWGLHVGYNPWTGWNYGVSWTNGFVSVGFTWSHSHYHHAYPCCGSAWYGGGYRGPVIINNGDINVGDINIGNNINAGNRENFSKKLENRSNADLSQWNKENLYKRAENISRNVDPGRLQERNVSAISRPDRANNVFADREGNVLRRTENNWQTREQQSWKNVPFEGPVLKSDRQANKTNNRENFNRKQTGPAFNRNNNFNSTDLNLDRAHRARLSASDRERMNRRAGGTRQRRR